MKKIKNIIKTKKIHLVIITFIINIFLNILFNINNFVYANIITDTNENISNNIDDISNEFDLNSYILKINEYVKNNSSSDVIDISKVSQDILEYKGLEFNSFFSKILYLIFQETFKTLKNSIGILIIIILLSILKNIQLDNDSSVVKLSFLVCYITIASILILTYIDILKVFTDIVSLLSNIMQIVSPFLMTIMLMSGAITTTSLVNPIILFLSNLVNFLTNYIVVPFITISLAFNIINSITDKLNLDRLAKFFQKAAVGLVTVSFSLILGILSLEAGIGVSSDSLAIKATKNVVSSVVPVVGNFLSDSFETVIGASALISSISYKLGVVAIIAITIVPIIKIFSAYIIYLLMSNISAMLCSDKKITSTIDIFGGVYKSLLGILIGIIALFIISLGILINMSSSIIK